MSVCDKCFRNVDELTGCMTGAGYGMDLCDKCLAEMKPPEQVSNVKALPGVVAATAAAHQPRPELVSLAKDLLRRAESGELQELVVAGITAKGDVTTAINTTGFARFTLQGALQHVALMHAEKDLKD